MFVYVYMCTCVHVRTCVHLCMCVCACMYVFACCVFSGSHKHTHSCTQVSQVDHESLQATVLRVVFDLLHLYGFESFNMDGGDCMGEDELEEEVDGKKQKHCGDVLCILLLRTCMHRAIYFRYDYAYPHKNLKGFEICTQVLCVAQGILCIYFVVRSSCT